MNPMDATGHASAGPLLYSPLTPEVGTLALAVALIMASLAAFLTLAGANTRRIAWMSVARPAAQGQCALLVLAFLCLTASFVAKDFSVLYVANNSNSHLPLIYRICAVWGAHEGSLLLWSLVLTGWMVAVARASLHLPEVFVARVLGVMSLVNVGFLAFILFTSNPFLRHFPAPPDGRDLNPLLQDPGLIAHPPMLYMGYVGLSVAFAFAIAALLGGRLDAAWARWTRPWTVVAWVFLTIGITLGSWWAYYELGWGGWWFWDPVENASFMPWLVATALIHSLAVTEQRDSFKSWTVLLAICAFALSLLGTFLVRSGVLTSVHAFAADPARGVFILIVLAIAVGGSLLLYAIRAPLLRDRGGFAIVSREGFLLANNVVLVVSAAAVLIGTLYPLAIDALGMGKLSVGPPYFNAVFAPLMLLLGALLGLGSRTRWKRQDDLTPLARLTLPVAVVLAVIAVLLAGGTRAVQAGAGFCVAFWIVLHTLLLVRERLGHRSSGARALQVLSRSFLGMASAHLGFAVCIIGVTAVSQWGQERDILLATGESTELGGWEFKLVSLAEIEGPNYTGVRGAVAVSHGGKVVATLLPEKRVYRAGGSSMTEAGIEAGVTRDLLASLGEPRGENAWTLRVQVKPFQRWVWFGGVMMALGGVLAASDRRYRLGVRRRVPAAELAPGSLPA
jgi:cytochrome c-type biogenesis protein CcmF